MKSSLFSRYTCFVLSITIALACLFTAFDRPVFWWPTLVFAALSALGIYDLSQQRHAICRNYPIIGRLRFFFEFIRPELRQYLLEEDDKPLPFSRSQRTLVYRRAKNEMGDKPFGTMLDVYQIGYECIGHSMCPVPVADPTGYRVTIGGADCTQPYSASLFNISAMSFGALSANAIRALNQGAAKGNFYHDTGEGSISRYHREHGGDLVWEIGSGYFGCRTTDGHFDAQRFAEQANTPQVKMIEIKLSQGAKPGHGGILPANKVDAEIAATRGVPEGQDCISPSAHSAFNTPIEMMTFIKQLRELSGGKPVGFKLCIGHPWEFVAIAKAMLQTHILPDFIVVDGKEGGTGAAPLELSNYMGMPLREGLLFVHNTLVGCGLRDRIKIGASGKIISAFDIASVLTLGADWVNSARGFMFAVGCIQSQSCHTNHCPTGVATQDPLRQKALVVANKAERVFHFHQNTVKALAEMLAAAGISRPEQLTSHHMLRRITSSEIKVYADIYYYLEPGALLEKQIKSDFYARMWRMATPSSFDAQAIVLT
ncbi:FMN-binding glutamate synthase family protein [Serratia sp. NPDC078593]|uniref:FMN-binding glutamate synthase family protein n=1 Tax=unclassified Serratia (in: enterobacteria) TaxID=2647522 RepID=UPI0037D1EA66